MKRSLVENLLLIFLFIGAVSTGGYLLLTPNSGARLDNERTDELGFLVPEGADVRVRSIRESNWSRLSMETSLYGEDHVFTGKNSSANIFLKSKQKISVNPNSLIVIRDKSQTLHLDVSEGGFFGVLKKGLKIVLQKDKSQSTLEITSENTSLSVEARPGNEIKLVVLKGEMQLKSNANSSTTLLKENSEAVITSPIILEDENAISQPSQIKIKQFSSQTLVPAPAAVLSNLKSPITLKWKWLNVGEDLKSANETSIQTLVEISKDPSFVDIYKSIGSQSSEVQITLPEDCTYFWRVKDAKDFSRTSPVSSFTLMSPPSFEKLANSEVVNVQIIQSAPMVTGVQGNREPTSEVAEATPPRPIETAVSVKNEEKLTDFPVEKVIATNSIKQKKVQTLEKQIFASVSDSSGRSPEETSLNTSLPTSNESALLESKKVFETGSDFVKPVYWVWAGLGASFLQVKENLDSYSEGKVSAVDLPQINLRSGGFINEHNGFDLQYIETPGHLKNSSGGTRRDEYFKWKNLNIDYLRTSSLPVTILNYSAEVIWKFGLQTHSLITIIPISPNSAELEVVPTNITNLSIGFGTNIRVHSKNRLELSLKYQHPIQSKSSVSSDNYSIRPIFLFDGSLGYIFELNITRRLGVYWGGQWQNINFDYTKGADSYKGTQLFFNSTIDVRIGGEF